MPRRAVPLVAGEVYHLYNRGNNRQEIFLERENYLFFLRRIRKYLAGESQTSKVWATIIAYCLMPNHFHLLVRPHDDQLSRRMQRLLISYTKAMNQRHQRVGALFQGQFQAVRVDRDAYLLHLARYIHLNPVTAGLANRPQDWEFSNYRDMVGLRHGTLTQPDVVLAQFSHLGGYEAFVTSYKPGDGETIAHLLFGESP